MQQWQAIVLIILIFGSLILSLYCLFFMVPLKRFWERVRSLGGGMKGIEAHVNGVLDQLGRRLNEVESSAAQQIQESREAAEAPLERLAKDSRGMQRELEVMRKELQSLQAQLREASADNRKVARNTESLTQELRQLRNDFDALDVELRESVRRLVADSFTSVESTVLSALDAIQDEIIHPTPGRTPSQPRSRPVQPAPRLTGRPAARGRDNIITVHPLFADLNQGQQEEEDEGDQGEAEVPPEESEAGQQAGGTADKERE